MTGRFPVAEAMDNVKAVAGKYVPDSMWQFIDHLGQLPDVATMFGQVFKVLGDKAASELPAEPIVAELIVSMQMVCANVARAAEQLEPAARRAHARELAKLDHPNGGLWDVGRL